MTILNYPYNFIVCDVGSKFINAYDPTSKQHSKITPDDFLNLNIPNLKNGMTIVIEDALLRSREDVSMAQTYDIEQLKELKFICDNRNIKIACFPQKSTPKTRKIYSLDKETLIEKTDKNDCVSIAFFLINFPDIYHSLKVWKPMTYGEHENRTKHLYKDRDELTLESNLARNEIYGIGKDNDYSDAVSEWIKKYITKTKGGTAFYDGDIDSSKYAGTGSGFEKETVEDWTSSVLSDPNLMAEEQEGLQEMLFKWKQSVPNPTKFDNPEEWLEYYFGDGADLASMDPDELKVFYQEQQAAGKAFIGVKGIDEFAPPGFEGFAFPGQEEPIPWSNLDPQIKKRYWEYFNSGQNLLGSDPTDPYYQDALMKQELYNEYLENLQATES